MTLWLVTHSYHYYPDSGTGDWRSVHTSEDEANDAYEALAAVVGAMGSTVYLIRISPDGFKEVRHQHIR